MSNLDVAVSSFWQLARHWKSGQKAKLELACEDGNLLLQLSASLGHPDLANFPNPPCPPPPSSCNKKSPSQLRRKERRKEEALAKAQKPCLDPETASKTVEEDTPKSVAIPDDDVKQHSEDPEKNPIGNVTEETEFFNCEQCDHISSCKASLRKHVMLEHKKPVTHERFKCNVCSENLDNKNLLTNHMIAEHYHPGELFSCALCDFITSRKAGLDIHVSKKHKEIEQIDGNTSDTEENYAEAYWERDELSSTYQRYLDVIEDIQSSNFTVQERESEIERAKNSRL